MPPAFNLSQDQTLQFNACYCFLFLRIGRSLNVLTSSAYLSISGKTLKTYLNTSVRLDTFASCSSPKTRTASPSSAHTYRLLVFKEHSHEPAPTPSVAYSTQTSALRSASLHQQQRNEI